MPQYRFCSKCGASVVDGDDRCRLCRTAVADMPVVMASVTAATLPPIETMSDATPDGAPLVGMWLSPRRTIRGILDTNPKYLVLPLAAIGGVFEALSRAAGKNAGDLIPLPFLLLIAVTFGALGGLAGLYFGGWIMHITGRWLGGNATREELRASIAWGTVPGLWAGLLWIPLLALTGNAVFSSDLEAAGLHPAVLLLSGGMLIVQAVAYIWSAFTSCHSIGEAQGFSAWRALGSAVLAFFLVIVPIIALGAGAAVIVGTLART